MSPLAIAWKSIRQRGLASALTGLSVALGVMLMVVVLVISGAVNNAFNQRSIAYDLIVGPKGSDLQLVLSAVFRIQPAIENLPYMYYQELLLRVQSGSLPFIDSNLTLEFQRSNSQQVYYQYGYGKGENRNYRA